MTKKSVNKRSQAASTQRYLPIAEIRDNVVILKDGTMRSVLLVSSLNFALKSEDEQNALVASYMSFLNSFDFPLQIVIQSRRLNIDRYIESLKGIEKKQTNDLLKIQIAEYRSYVAELVELGEIVTKRFFVVIPYDPQTNRKQGFWPRFKAVLFPGVAITMNRERFTKYIHELMQRVNHISTGLASLSLSSVLLDTQSLIELYYTSYNPDVSENQPMGSTNDVRVEATATSTA